MKTIATLLLCVTVLAGAEKKKTTQPQFDAACATVYDIVSRRMGLTVAPGLDASVTNMCAGPSEIFVTIGYYDSRGVQIGTGIEVATVAERGTWKFHHSARFTDGQVERQFKSARVILVRAFQAQ